MLGLGGAVSIVFENINSLLLDRGVEKIKTSSILACGRVPRHYSDWPISGEFGIASNQSTRPTHK